MNPIEEFILAIDRGWQRPQDPKILLRVLGSTALMLQTDYFRGTKDGDVLEAVTLTPEIKDRLLALAGKKTKLAEKHAIYLDIVPLGLPFFPLKQDWQPMTEFNRSLSCFELVALGIVDTVVTKIKRFNANDQADIQAMIRLGLAPHATVVERFRSAIDRFSGDARAMEFPEYVKHLHRVEREFFETDESEIELPSWI